MSSYALDILIGTFVFRQRPTDEIVDTITDLGRIIANRESRITHLPQSVVARIAQIVNSIEQRSVQVEDDN